MDNAQQYNSDGMEYFRRGLYKKAIQEFTLAINCLPVEEESSDEQMKLRRKILHNRAYTYYHDKCFEDAIKEFSSIIGLCEDNDEIVKYLYIMSEANYKMLKFDETRSCLDRAIALNTKDNETYKDTLVNMFSRIRNGEFTNRNDITEIVIPSTVTIIGAEAFAGCKNLKRVVLPDGLASMGENAFRYCKSLEHIVIPGSLKEIPLGAFQCCANLTRIDIENGVEIISEHAFDDASAENIKLPASIKKIKKSAFFSNSVKSITIGSGVSLGADAFCYNFASDYKEQGKAAGTYVIVPGPTKSGAFITKIKEKEVWLNWVREKDTN